MERLLLDFKFYWIDNELIVYENWVLGELD